MPHYQIALNFSTYLPEGLGDEELNAVMEELSLLGSPEGIKVRDIGAIVRSSRGQVLFRIGISAVAGGIILVGAYCCCCMLCSQNIQDLIRLRWWKAHLARLVTTSPEEWEMETVSLKRSPGVKQQKGGKVTLHHEP